VSDPTEASSVERLQRLEAHVDRLHRAFLDVLAEHELRIDRLTRIIDATITAPILMQATAAAPKH
jgi:hypothetical protein